ncbi:MAG: MotA/TolQ/ExbB proton channel family protein [Phycisphaerales bacterium]|nr:MotA/TolQ/ExbB proton channel family protein [Phycisphaerales bacterium]
MKRSGVRRGHFAAWGLLLSAGAVPAWAAEGGKSFLDIFWEGIEIPTYFIAAGSVAAIALIVEHFVAVRRATIAPPQQVQWAREQIEKRNFRECLDKLRESHTYFAQTMTAALQHARHGFDAMHAAAVEKSGLLGGKLFRKAEYLNILGNLGPLLGLLGTVWGMIEAFGTLGASGGQADAAGLSEGISKALVNTLAGLALAIVGIGFFGLCRNRIESLTVGATVDVLDLLEYFRPSARSSSGGERAATAPATTKASRGAGVAPAPGTAEGE